MGQPGCGDLLRLCCDQVCESRYTCICPA